MRFFFFARNFLNQEISKFSAFLCLAATLAVLAGCGSSGSPAVAPATSATPVAATVQLLVSSPQLPSSGVATIDLTAVLLSSTGQTVAGLAVTFSNGADPSAFFSNISNGGVSDANGTVTAKLNLGVNKTNRTITVTATSGSATGTNTVDVVGTAITISGASSLAFGASTTLTFSLRDSAGVAVPGITLGVASATGNTVVRTPATGITSGSGQITAAITANAVPAVNDTITATGGGATATQALTISSASFTFTTPAAATEIPLSTAIPPVPTPISVNWTNAGVPVVGSLVSFSSTRGTVAGSPVATNALGTATASISSTSAGAATITATGPGGVPAATLNVVFIATTASSLTVQAVPGTVQVTTGAAGQTSNSSTISVVVRDAGNNLVKNASVNFTITADPTGGSLTSASGTTDVNGTTSVTYIAGAISSPQNGVIISATVTAVNGVPLVLPIISTATLTVSGQPLLVRLGTDNLVGSTPPVNTKTWVAIVTDASGNAVVGATVRFSLRPAQYRKGFYTAGATTWVQTINVTCANEDPNFNGIIDPLAFPPPLPASQTEDTNFSGSLEPGGIATVNASAVTNASGIATAVVTYPKDHGTWAEMILEARTGVVGNDPPTTATFFLVGLASDYNVLTVAPPGPISPYGAGVAPDNVCTNTR